MQVGSVDAGLSTGAISLPRGELEPRHRPALREAALAETAPGRLGPALPSLLWVFCLPSSCPGASAVAASFPGGSGPGLGS